MAPVIETGPHTSSFLYGKGVFTTIAMRRSLPLLWEKHWRRLMAHAAAIGIDLSQVNEATARDTLDELIASGGITRGRIRITLSDESASSMWSSPGSTRTKMSMIAGGPSSVSADLRLTVSAHMVNSTSPLAGIKSCNYLEHLMAYDEAKRRGSDEAIRLNERGEVTSACMANVFWLKDGRVFTPSLATGCLAGTTREFVMENIRCLEVESGIEMLYEADAIYLTSAGLGVVSVAGFGGRELQKIDHPITDLTWT